MSWSFQNDLHHRTKVKWCKLDFASIKVKINKMEWQKLNAAVTLLHSAQQKQSDFSESKPELEQKVRNETIWWTVTNSEVVEEACSQGAAMGTMQDRQNIKTMETISKRQVTRYVHTYRRKHWRGSIIIIQLRRGQTAVEAPWNKGFFYPDGIWCQNSVVGKTEVAHNHSHLTLFIFSLCSFLLPYLHHLLRLLIIILLQHIMQLSNMQITGVPTRRSTHKH